ncbi:hypothetical protein FD00_GL001071 [Liquorilactobacillus mali KCTC 3596 = DSM 20444]|uniref:Uncharacterized protein n=1 Tax=Liquorilactobacillus mali KCTC 3596 = DSM 20444 TaxID=1046596 RepID=A0A0R2E6P1_9LACO|nr:hypothetical protein FD00_GL001071 [Liquorilactobacillus mali KCTC 3596 = DSM 20444]
MYVVIEDIDFFGKEDTTYREEEISVTRINTSSIYVKFVGQSREEKFKLRGSFPISDGGSMLGLTEYLTDNPDLADEWSEQYQHNKEVNWKLDELFKKVKELSIEEKEDFLAKNKLED